MKLPSILYVCTAILVVAASALPTETGVPCTSSGKGGAGNATTSVMSVNTSQSYESYVVEALTCGTCPVDDRQQCYLRFNRSQNDSYSSRVVASCVSEMNLASRFQVISDLDRVTLRYESTAFYVVHETAPSCGKRSDSMLVLRHISQVGTKATQFTLERYALEGDALERYEKACNAAPDRNVFRLRQRAAGQGCSIVKTLCKKLSKGPSPRCYTFHKYRPHNK